MATWLFRILAVLSIGLLVASAIGWHLDRDLEWVSMPSLEREVSGLLPLQEQVVTFEIHNDRWWPIRVVGLAQC